MTTYTAIPNGDVDQDSPVTQTLMTLLRDNPIAITEGASGAPRITDAALSTGATGTGQAWVTARLTTAAVDNAISVSAVAARSIAIGLGGVGSYALLRQTQAISVLNPGATKSGDALTYSPATNGLNTGPLPGTWRLHGYTGTIGNEQISVWQRIA